MLTNFYLGEPLLLSQKNRVDHAPDQPTPKIPLSSSHPGEILTVYQWAEGIYTPLYKSIDVTPFVPRKYLKVIWSGPGEPWDRCFETCHRHSKWNVPATRGSTTYPLFRELQTGPKLLRQAHSFFFHKGLWPGLSWNRELSELPWVWKSGQQMIIEFAFWLVNGTNFASLFDWGADFNLQWSHPGRGTRVPILFTALLSTCQPTLN